MPADTILTFLAARPACRVALITHQRPDGDAIGSSMGLAHLLRAAGYRPAVVNPRPLPLSLAFIADSSLILDTGSDDWWKEFDCVGVLDFGEPGRADEINRAAMEKLPVFTVDHHVTSAGIGEAVWIEPEASSTGEMVVKLSQAAGWEPDEHAAMALWTAIASDTGRFSHENTTPDALAAARECVLAGARPALAAQMLFQSYSRGERQLQKCVLERMELYAGGRLGTSWLRRQDFDAAGAGAKGAQDLIDLIRDTAGVETAIFFYEPQPGSGEEPTIKISLRARAPHSALDIASRYGGGGHLRAAGAAAAGTLDAVRREVTEAALKAYFPDASPESPPEKI